MRTDSVEGDLSDVAAVERLIQMVLDGHGGIDEWKAVIQINLFSMVLLSTAFARGMKTRGCFRIVNMTAGIKDTPQVYELRGTGVLVNHLDPGWLETDMAGPGADFEVETVLPGALAPALLDNDGVTGTGFRAQECRTRS